jgi:signal transduction histidine kinase
MKSFPKLKPGSVKSTTGSLAAAKKERVLRLSAQGALKESDQRYKLLLVQHRRMQGQMRNFTQRILTAQEDERRKISRELHDGVVQLLAGISVQLAMLTLSADSGGPGLKRKIVRTQKLVEKSIEAVHHFARELRPAMLDDLGLVPALRSLVIRLRTTRRLNVRITAYAGVEEIARDKRTVLFRVAQEALTNVGRHAHANHVHIRIRRQGRAAVLEVEDDGVSFDLARVLASRSRKRLGLLGMRERVEMVGGRFEVESTPGDGTVVRASIPI